MKASITISRPSFGDGRNKIVVQIKDSLSKIRFLEVEIDLDIFTAALTGLSEQECDIKVKSLELVGKKKEQKHISFNMPKHNYENRNDIAMKYAKEILKDGWLFNGYLGSKDSFTGHGDDVQCNSTIYRYI